MYRVIQGNTQNLSDVETFLDFVSTLDRHPLQSLRQLFNPNAELFVTRAPGRLDVMGGIADYSGSLVLELPIAEATLVALQRDQKPKLTITSLLENSNQQLKFEMPLAEFPPGGEPVDYAFARDFFQKDSESHWAAYVAGAFLVLMRERQVAFSNGARILISSRVPQGKGVSSSAALEVAAMQAIAAAFGVSVEPRELALLCQKIENFVAGAPCGVMDQMTAICGETNRLVALLCQPAELRESVPIPPEISFWGLDSGIRHSISGADYGSVRVGAFMGYRIIADLAGLNVTSAADGRVRIDDPVWGGYLSNVTPKEFEQVYAAAIPERMTGARFLKRYHGTTDEVTRVHPDRTYAVRSPTAHAIYEHQRVRDFAELLKPANRPLRLELLGELMYQSHASYSACGLGSDGTNRLVELVRAAGPPAGLYGAKITGGGSGGTVAVLGTREARSSLNKIAEQYAIETGYLPYLFEGSSAGSAAFGYLKLRPVNQI
jgi:galactokinase